MIEVADERADLIADWTARVDDLEFVSQAQIEFVASQAGLDESSLDSYSWEGRTVERHRAFVRGFLGFRECTTTDAEDLVVWVIEDVGMAVARAKGKLKGRQPKLSNKQQAELRRMHDAGDHSITDLADVFSISRPTVYRTLKRTAPT